MGLVFNMYIYSTGYHFGRSTSKCYSFTKPVQNRWVNGIGSIKTKTCVVLHFKEDCVGRSVKTEAPGTTNLTHVWEFTATGERILSLLYTKYPNWKWETKPYHIFNKEKGSFSLNVNILSKDQTVKQVGGPTIIETYRDIYSCRSVPEYVQQLDKWFIDNHVNAMVAYFLPDCSPTAYPTLWIPAGIELNAPENPVVWTRPTLGILPEKLQQQFYNFIIIWARKHNNNKY